MAKKRAWLNPKIAIAIAVLAVAVGYLMYTSVQSTSASFFGTVSEVHAQGAAIDGDLIRVGGDVVEDSIETDGVGGAVDFEITDGEQTLAVTYDGQVPDIFDEHVEAVVEGTYEHGGVFQAESVMTKCPSKFEDSEEDGHEKYFGDDETASSD